MKCVSMLLGAGCLAMLVYEIEAFSGYKDKATPGPTCKTPVGTLNVGKYKVDNAKCLNYTCDEEYYSFCGIGYNSKVKRIKGCVKKKLEDCCYRLVKKDDPSKICQEKKCPEDDIKHCQ